MADPSGRSDAPTVTWRAAEMFGCKGPVKLHVQRKHGAYEWTALVKGAYCRSSFANSLDEAQAAAEKAADDILKEIP